MKKKNTNTNIVLKDNKNISVDRRVDPREEKLLDNLLDGMNPSQAAKHAGYSQHYCKVDVYRKVKSNKFITKLKDRFLQSNNLNLSKISKINNLVLDRLVKDAENGDLASIAKLKHIPKQILQLAGLLQADNAPVVQQQINIGQVQAHIQTLVNPQIPDSRDKT